MISNSSLQAFSAVQPTQSANRPNPVRQVRAQPDAAPRQASPTPALPDARPSLPPPRGSLLNLSI